MNKRELSPQIFLLFQLFLFIVPIVRSTITQEWLFWPSDTNGKLKVNSADNISKIKNANKTETLNLRYSVTNELINLNDAQLNPVISSIDLTYFSSELLKQEKFNNDKYFIPLFGNYETGLHIAITTKEEISEKKKVNQLMKETCQFINKLFAYSGFTLCKEQDLINFTNLENISPVSPKHYYMFLADFNFEEMDGYSLYHIFGLALKPDLELGCEFDDEVIDDWTSKYFNIVISLHPNMLDIKDNSKDEDNTVMIKFEEILHFKFPEIASCKVNLHLNEVSVIDNMVKTENNGYLIKNINPRGKKNDELVYIPCPLPKIKFNYKLSPGVGLHPVLFTTIETQEWTEDQPLSMILTLDPNIFADEYQINSKKYEKGINVSVYGHPDLEVAVTDPQAKFNYVKVIFSSLSAFTKKTIEIPLHLRYPEIYQESINENKNVGGEKNKENTSSEEKKNDSETDNDNSNENYDNRHFKQITINPPRFYTSSNKLCHQNSFSSGSLPMLILSSIEKDRSHSVSIIPVKVMSSHQNNQDKTNSSIEPLRIDVPRGQLSHYSTITYLTLVVTLLGIIFIIYSMIKYSKFNTSKGLSKLKSEIKPSKINSSETNKNLKNQKKTQ